MFLRAAFMTFRNGAAYHGYRFLSSKVSPHIVSNGFTNPSFDPFLLAILVILTIHKCRKYGEFTPTSVALKS